MGRVADGVAVFDRHGRPVLKSAVNRDGGTAGHFRHRPDALVAADILRHLHIVIVGIAAFHGMDTAVEFGIVLVHEEEIVFAAHKISRGLRWTAVLACGPFIPVVDVQELRVGLKRFFPALLEIDTVAFGIFHCFAEPGHVCGHGQIKFIQFGFAVFAGPAFTGQAGRVLGGGDRRLLLYALVQGKQFFRLHRFHVVIAQVVAETPVVFRADGPFARPFVIAPPHGAQREEVFHFLRIVGIKFFRIVGIIVMGVIRVGFGRCVIMQVGMLNAAPVGVHRGGAVV